MSSLWRRRGRGRSHGAGKRDDGQQITNSAAEVQVPTHFRCPISLHLMKDPVSLATGITYDREFIETWIDTGHATCPVSNQVLRNSDQIPNHALRKMIQEWCVENKPYGVERIPTPRVPLAPYEVNELRSEMAAATRGLDENKHLQLLMKMKNWAKESDRNRKCLVKNGIGTTLAETFVAFARFSVEKHGNLLKEVLSALTWSFPLGKHGVSKLRSTASLRCMVQLLNGGDLSSRRSAILVLRELVISDEARGFVDGLMEIEGIEGKLLQAVKVPICPRSTHACLVVMHHVMVSSQDPTITSKFIKLGVIDSILEILVDGSKGICEKALVVLDEACGTEEGRESACGHALAVPILVKKILRVSDAATERCVSILWNVCVGGECEDGVVEALKVGGFQKLLVVLQVGCEGRMKEKVSELLRFMNLYRDKVECFDSSMGFKNVKTYK